jgi:protein gp37
MAETTDISWAHSTFNPWIGCTRVSPGCDNCYAATLMQDRYQRVKWGAGEARSRTKTWDQPRRWNKQAAASGKPWRVFCASLADVFDNEVPGAWRADLFDLIEATPALTWMVLTKRIGNVGAMAMPDNVWLGSTVVNQEEADRDIPKLLRIRAPVRFLSCEPLLGPLNLCAYLRELQWVIVGGESGAGARPMDPEWPVSIRDQCEGFKVPFHFKQWGPRGIRAELHGREHFAFPD